MKRWLPALLLCLLSLPSTAEDMLMVRSHAAFEESMLMLQEAISKQGYVLSRVQRVDIGLTGSGYKTDKYRVVFFGKPEEVRELSTRYPGLIPYLPLQIAIFAEADETLLVAANPMRLSTAYDDPELDKRFARWEQDLQGILDRVRAGE